jgi:Flp pilus assembly protein TadG
MLAILCRKILALHRVWSALAVKSSIFSAVLNARGKFRRCHAAVLNTTLHRYIRSREANVAITFALASLPTIYLLGMGLDYSSTVRRQSQLDAAADAAAIAAVTPAMMAQATQIATTAASNVFNA